MNGWLTDNLRRLNTYGFQRKSLRLSRSNRLRASPVVEGAVVMDTGVTDGVIAVVVGGVVVVEAVEVEAAAAAAVVLTREGRSFSRSLKL